MRREELVVGRYLSRARSRPGRSATGSQCSNAGKLFALCPVDTDPPEISLKRDPTLATALRLTYRAVRPAVTLTSGIEHGDADGSVDDEVEEWIDHSYKLIVATLPRSQRRRRRRMRSGDDQGGTP